MINFDIFNPIRTIFDINWTRFNRFRRDNLIRFQEFESKKLIKRKFKFDFKLNLAQGQSNRISLPQEHHLNIKIVAVLVVYM